MIQNGVTYPPIGLTHGSVNNPLSDNTEKEFILSDSDVNQFFIDDEIDEDHMELTGVGYNDDTKEESKESWEELEVPHYSFELENLRKLSEYYSSTNDFEGFEDICKSKPCLKSSLEIVESRSNNEPEEVQLPISRNSSVGSSQSVRNLIAIFTDRSASDNINGIEPASMKRVTRSMGKVQEEPWIITKQEKR